MLEFQRKLLGDKIRNVAFKKALQTVIRKGRTVLADVGSGTGYLSFLASKLGAKQCYLYEFSELSGLCKKLAQQNDIRNCAVVSRHSAKVKRPKEVDVVVSETIGNFALEENILENMETSKRFLKKGGALIPGKLAQYVAPVISDRLMKTINVWENLEFDFSMAKEISLNNMYVRIICPEDILPNSKLVFDDINFYQKNESIRKNTVSWAFTKSFSISGFAVWWEAELVPGVHLSTSPFMPLTHWEQIFLPLSRSLSTQAGDQLELTIATDSRYTVGIRVQWDAKLLRHGKTLQKVSMDTDKGLAYAMIMGSA